MYSRIKESYQAVGEQIIILHMFHPSVDRGTQPDCVCFNDIYGQEQSVDCPYCYGTTLAGGIKEAWRSWAIVNDDDENEKKSQYGVWQNEGHSVQLEPFPDMMQNDYIVRVEQWDSTQQIPLIIGRRYLVSSMQDITLRTGNRFGGSERGRIAQKANISILPKEHIIYGYDIRTDVAFPRYDGEVR
jgi:hypothetical protein